MSETLVNFLYGIIFVIELIVALIYFVKFNIYLIKRHYQKIKSKRSIATKLEEISQSQYNNLSPSEREFLNDFISKKYFR